MSFSFDFALSTGDEPKNEELPPPLLSSASLDTGGGITDKLRNHLVPFCWMTNVQELLEQRRQDQIIYDEVSIIEEENIATHTRASSKEPLEGQDKNIVDDNTLRRVDLTRSSFMDLARRDEIDRLPSNDLVPGIYEGGLKVWESSVDLVRYMHQEQGLALPWMVSAVETSDNVATTPIRCLELGCGHGLPA
eukprot:scaffold22361_cov184-Amphora_coffeaeformis.AAC.3